MVAEKLLRFGAREVGITVEQFEKLPTSAYLLKIAKQDYDKDLLKKGSSVDRNVAEVLFMRFVSKKIIGNKI